jgi:hypothetical protein
MQELKTNKEFQTQTRTTCVTCNRHMPPGDRHLVTGNREPAMACPVTGKPVTGNSLCQPVIFTLFWLSLPSQKLNC